MAYTGYLQTTARMTLTQRRDGAFFMRESTGYGKFGRNPSAWQPVKSIEIDSVGHIIADGINFGTPSKCDTLTYLINKDLPAFVFELPAVEVIKGEPKIIRVEECYNDNNGAYQKIYWRGSDGVIRSLSNMYDQSSDFSLFTINDLTEYVNKRIAAFECCISVQPAAGNN